MALAGGTALRLVGLAYGLPHVYNPDEVAIMNRAMGLSQNGLDPHNFLYPSLYFYALFVWEGLWFVLGRITGVFGSLAAFERAFFVDPTSIYVAGRLLTVICGLGTIVATWRLGRRLFGATAGATAAVLLAVAPLAVRDAHYVKHDVPVTLLIVLTTVVLAAELLGGRARRRWLLPGALAGLAMSTHYYAVFLAVPLAIVAMAPAFPGEPVAARWRRLALTGAAAAGAFLLASPFLLVEPSIALRDIVANRQIVVDRATTSGGWLGSLGFYVSWLGRDGVGWFTGTLAIVGLGVTVRAGWKRAVLVLAFPGVFLLFIANTVPASRYLNPVVPFVAVAAGAAAAWIGARGTAGRVAVVALLGAALVEAGVASVRTDLFFRQTDTRTLALRWVEGHVPDGASVLVQPYSVPLWPSRDALIEALTRHIGSPERASVKFRRELALSPYPSPAYRPIFLGTGGLDEDKIYVAPSDATAGGGLGPLRALAVTYVVLKRYNEPDQSLTALTRALERDGHLVATFSPYRADVGPARRLEVAPFLHNTDARIASALARPGPIVEIWKIE